MSHFNNYSARNIRLIQAQLQGATMVASSTEWKKRNGHVKAGEKALYIQAPVNVIKKGEDGKPIINKETGKKEIKPLKAKNFSFRKLLKLFQNS